MKLSVRVWPREPRLSDLVEMDVTVEAQPDVEIKPPAFGQAVGDFLIRDYSERPPAAGSGNVRRFHYQLEPAHAGKHLIRSVSIEFVDRRANSEAKALPVLIETEPLEVKVTSEFGGAAPSLANLEPMVVPQSVPRVSGMAWVIGVVVAGVLAIAAAVVVVRRRKRRPIEVPRQSAEEIARGALAALLAENLPARGLIKEFYLRLTGIVRQYVEDTTGIRRLSRRPRSSCATCGRGRCFRESGVRLAEFLEAADLIKYAGQQPQEGQIDEAIARARVRGIGAGPVRGDGRRPGELDGNYQKQARLIRWTRFGCILLSGCCSCPRPWPRSGGDFVRAGAAAVFSSVADLKDLPVTKRAADQTMAAVRVRPGLVPGDHGACAAAGGEGGIADFRGGNRDRDRS